MIGPLRAVAQEAQIALQSSAISNASIAVPASILAVAGLAALVCWIDARRKSAPPAVFLPEKQAFNYSTILARCPSLSNTYNAVPGLTNGHG
jgi:hypothetical protein